MESIFELFKAATSLSPLGIIALLAGVIAMLVKAKNEMSAQVKVIGDNHLHEMPELVENSRRSVEVLQRIEVKLGENFAVIHSRLDGK